MTAAIQINSPVTTGRMKEPENENSFIKPCCMISQPNMIRMMLRTRGCQVLRVEFMSAFGKKMMSRHAGIPTPELDVRSMVRQLTEHTKPVHSATQIRYDHGAKKGAVR